MRLLNYSRTYHCPAIICSRKCTVRTKLALHIKVLKLKRLNFQTDTSVMYFVLTINTSVCPHMRFHIKWIQIQGRSRTPYLTLVHWKLEEIRDRNYLCRLLLIRHLPLPRSRPMHSKTNYGAGLVRLTSGPSGWETLSVASAVTRRRLCSPWHHYKSPGKYRLVWLLLSLLSSALIGACRKLWVS